MKKRKNKKRNYKTTNWTTGNNYKENGIRLPIRALKWMPIKKKESTRKTEEKLDGSYKEQKKPKSRPMGR
jgi:hypothetical protein